MSNNRRRETYFGRIKHFGRHEALELSGTAISEMCGVESRHSRPKLLACLGGTMPLVSLQVKADLHSQPSLPSLNFVLFLKVNR